MPVSLEPVTLQPATISWMIEHGFDPQRPDRPARYNDTPLILASRQGRLDVVADLAIVGEPAMALNHRNMDGTNALWAAVVANDYAIADLLVTLGIDIDNLNDNGASVLMYAASSGKASWVAWLLEKGADTQAATLDGFTALDLASNIDCLRLLKPSRTRAAEA
ncbi:MULTISPECIES: ankyrin repeat domain-containing protein [unclassified Oceanobacter]|uniref:ankyrin repeat domain-containing protein n=1 Tax=unclassified Oceanobacter TaxID=2620260 RepID=UPI0026E3FDCD|nr:MULTISPECIES: ankyrin repeat domain-containing protein [unclassified Oceanobacter]MDO6681694.1 ankyrin repeat domain-containing protein [Oceanobacter sp. 5_MG-2023]MDP2505678.1 ankyrin repeat domain-containing protein [Oceanobacter sp. 3_MG-2023]MDP2547495.1 ankyrin repeat domain-containing protein [Oceanobacter sp. 4_MG-2023]MDP2608283.1 ankyrin repeat domain-containing protein [Oceanobacter sp. 1_MG-2023]MDP2612168.1 ankyrin repeat domain-containing protein [Oceanobacter sp. 2_MG-2023]